MEQNFIEYIGFLEVTTRKTNTMGYILVWLKVNTVLYFKRNKEENHFIDTNFYLSNID